jgi:hypothetical protein
LQQVAYVSIHERRVSSWGELQESLYQDSWRPSIERFRSSFAFRGSQDAKRPLASSLVAAGYQRHEHHMLRNFRKYAQRDSVPGDSVWNWLALAQHHGLPTRLMDWTYSPYVALHFMTRETSKFHCDGVVWCIDYDATNRLLPAPLRKLLEEEGSSVFTAEMLERVAPSLHQFDGLSEEEFVIFLEPPSFDDRIVNQFAFFSLTSHSDIALEEWLETRPDVYRRIVVPAELKWEVRDKLDQANITERVLFPGLDGLSLWLKRYYYRR